MKIIELKLQEAKTGEGITAISLVKHPAIEQTWIAFSEGQKMKPDPRFMFKTIDKEQRILAGPAMVPDKLIYRVNDEGEEFFVFFKEDTIRELSERFLLQGKQNSMTLEHEATLNDLSVVESWIVEDPEKDKSALYGFDLPVGSWFVKVKVLNDDVWALVKEKSVSGFSVEGVFTQELIKQSKQMKKTTLDKYLDKIRGLFSEEQAEAVRQRMAKISQISKWEIEVKNETFAVGDQVVGVYEDGSEYPIQSGEYVLENGSKIQLDSDSKIVLIQEAGEFSLPKQGEPEDQGEESGAEKFGSIEAQDAEGTAVTINFPGEVLEVGAAITHTVDGEEVPVPTGEYVLSDGNILVVAEEGVVGDLRAATEDTEDMEHDDGGLKAEQLDKLIDGIAEIIASFKAELKQDFNSQIKAVTKSLRTELNLPGANHKDEVPDGGEKKAIVQGLSRFVSEAKEKSKP